MRSRSGLPEVLRTATTKGISRQGWHHGQSRCRYRLAALPTKRCASSSGLPSAKSYLLRREIRWSPNVPDENMTKPSDRVEAKTNSFAYVMGLTDTSNPSFPRDRRCSAIPRAVGATIAPIRQKGGVWKGKDGDRRSLRSKWGRREVHGGHSPPLHIQGSGGKANQADTLSRLANWLSDSNTLLLPNTP